MRYRRWRRLDPIVPVIKQSPERTQVSLPLICSSQEDPEEVKRPICPAAGVHRKDAGEDGLEGKIYVERVGCLLRKEKCLSEVIYLHRPMSLS